MAKISISQITACCSDNIWYVFGLGSDGRVYSWEPSGVWHVFIKEEENA